jgi:hypothetical protein
MIIKAKPKLYLKTPNNRIRKIFFDISQNKYFDYFILVCIILNTVILAVSWKD